jgi:hypothetical protein
LFGDVPEVPQVPEVPGFMSLKYHKYQKYQKYLFLYKMNLDGGRKIKMARKGVKRAYQRFCDKIPNFLF